MPDEAVVTNEPVKAPADEGEAEEEPEIKIPARRRRASDDEAEEGADEFHDAENADEAGEHGDNLIGILRRPIRLPTISTKIFNFGDPAPGDDEEADDPVEDKAAPAVSASAAPGADWGDEEEEEGDKEDEEGAVDTVAKEGEKEPKALRIKREPFEVPMQGHSAWLHDDRFDEAEAAAHEE